MGASLVAWTAAVHGQSTQGLSNSGGGQWEGRTKITLCEYVGIARQREPVETPASELRDAARQREIRVTDASGREIPSQIVEGEVRDLARLDADDKVLFLADCPANAKVDYYVHYGNPRAAAPIYPSPFTIAVDRATFADCYKRIDTGAITAWLCCGIDGRRRNGIRRFFHNGERREFVPSRLGGGLGCVAHMGGRNFYDQVFKASTVYEGPVAVKYRLEATVGSVRAVSSFTFFAGSTRFHHSVHTNDTSDQSASGYAIGDSGQEDAFRRYQTDRMDAPDTTPKRGEVIAEATYHVVMHGDMVYASSTPGAYPCNIQNRAGDWCTMASWHRGKREFTPPDRMVVKHSYEKGDINVAKALHHPLLLPEEIRKREARLRAEEARWRANLKECTYAYAQSQGMDRALTTPEGFLDVGCHSCPVVVDWDGDGKKDVITGCYGYSFGHIGEEGLIFLYRNIGANNAPVLAAPVPLNDHDGEYLNTDTMIAYPCVIDWDNDGDLDIVCGTHHNFVVYSENVGTRREPKLRPFKKMTADGKVINLYEWYTSPKAVDWDGDGDLDLIVGRYVYRDRETKKRAEPYPYGPIAYFENIGTREKPMLTARANLQADGRELRVKYAARPTPVDWDGDGDLDLIVGDFSYDGIHYFENTGTRREPILIRRGVLQADGKPLLVHDTLLTVPKMNISVEVVDWDEDGRDDLLLGSATGFLYYYRNTGTNAKRELTSQGRLRVKNARISTGGFATPAAADFDRDGDIDLVCGNEGVLLVYFENAGTPQKPSFSEGVPVEAGGETVMFFGEGVQLNDKYWGYANPEAGDFDGDGDADLLVQASKGRWKYFESVNGAAKPQFARGTDLLVDGEIFRTHWRLKAAAADWDGDGDLDFVCPDRAGVVGLYTNEGGRPPRFHRRSPLRLSDGQEFSSKVARTASRTKFAAVDWDEDGDYDLILGDFSAICLYRNVGDRTHPTFKSEGLLKVEGKPFKHMVGEHSLGITFADLDADGKEDLIVGSDTGFMFWYPRVLLGP